MMELEEGIKSIPNIIIFIKLSLLLPFNSDPTVS